MHRALRSPGAAAAQTKAATAPEVHGLRLYISVLQWLWQPPWGPTSLSKASVGWRACTGTERSA